MVQKVIDFVKENLTVLVICALIAFEIPFCALIIKKVSYTEIDWIAYMQEVQGFEDGERNYFNLRGDTGPLVYPAGFVYVFSVLKALTDDGHNLFKGQVIFAGIYLIVLSAVLKLYAQGKTVPALAFCLLAASKRIHSIFVLRMFNDCVAILFGYLAIVLFTQKKWKLGCFLYSAAVSIKMNMLLYAPGVLFCLLVGTGFSQTVICLSICAGLQLLLGLPFLTTFPYEYLKGSFDLGRVFMFKWTVNFKFLPEEYFVSKIHSISLLLLTIAAFVVFAFKWTAECRKQLKVSSPREGQSLIASRDLTSNFIIVTLFASNFIGVVFARSLHYQFYCWFFHTLPYLAWHAHILPVWLKLGILLGIEVAFNVYPATPWSSVLLQVCHCLLLVGLYFAPVPSLTRDPSSEATKRD